MHTCAYSCGGQRLFRSHSAAFEKGVSLDRSSPSRLGWLGREPQDLPASVPPAPGLHIYAIKLDWMFLCVLVHVCSREW